MNQNLAYTIAKSGNATIYLDFKPYAVNVGATNYDSVLEILASDAADKLERLYQALDIRKALTKHLSQYIDVIDNELYYQGVLIQNELATRIVEFFHKRFPVKNLIAFFERLQANPEVRAQNELFTFLERNGLHITDDGHFLAYKKVTHDYKDKYTGTFDNSLGKLVHELRDLCDKDGHTDCGRGLHVGTFEFASGFGSRTYGGPGQDRLILVKVDPANCVSVPFSSTAKMRVCEYLVIADVSNDTEVKDAFVPETKVSQLPQAPVATVSQVAPKTTTPQRDSKGRFLSKSAVTPVAVAPKKELPKRDSKGHFLPKSTSVATYASNVPKRDSKGRFQKNGPDRSY
jgi:hypothetical protein